MQIDLFAQSVSSLKQAMEEQESNTSRKCTPRTTFRGNEIVRSYHYHHQLLQNYYNRLGYGFGFAYQNQNQFYPALLPLPPTIPLQLTVTPSFTQNRSFGSETRFPKESCNQDYYPLATSSDSIVPDFSNVQVRQEIKNKVCLPSDTKNGTYSSMDVKHKSLIVARRPDSGGVEGRVVTLLANHFLVKFKPSQRIFHYDVEISPNPSKEVARMIKKTIVQENSSLISGALPVYDGGRTLYSPIEFIEDRLEFYINLPICEPPLSVNSVEKQQRDKIFRVNIKLVSKFDGEILNKYLNNKGDDCTPLPQEYIHALDIVLRESPTEKCIASGRSFYSSLMGGAKEIGGGAVAFRGFFQSLRPTQQGLALNMDFSVTAFHESIGVISYLQKRLNFMHDIFQKKTRSLTNEENNEVERTLKNFRVFVSHRETVQKYRVYSLTEEITENLCFPDRDGNSLRVVNYFKEHYGYDIQFRNLPCLQISRRKPCYLPMELCVICEGQKFLGKLSDDQTAKIIKIGCQGPRERKAIINGVMDGSVGPISGTQGKEFKLQVSKEMTKLTGRILQPPKLKLGKGGHVRNLTPIRHDCQWNLLDSHVVEGTRVERWALLSFGGTSEQKSIISKFIYQLSKRCEQLGIFLQENPVINPIFEPMHVLGNPKILESKLKKIQLATFNNLQLLICVMERKHKGYSDLKRIAETSIGVISQCCLYSNIDKLSSQFLANLTLKINAKVGGSTVALYNSLPSQIPRIFREDEPVIFMGADVTHPHPLDDSSPSIAAVVGSVNWPGANKYISRMRSQTHRQEIIQNLGTMISEILDDFYKELSKLPSRIIFFRDGVSETQFYKVLKDELQEIRGACSRFPDYNPPITFVVVQKRHHTRLFPCETDASFRENENIVPGTVVDSTITHPREFDFYLCSHWSVKGTTRPIHYHVLWDDSGFTSDEVQKLVYNLCYTFVRCTKPVSLVPPAYYAHLAAYRGRLYLDRSDSSAFGRSSTISRVGPPKEMPLPKLSENIRNLMFYC